MAVKYKESQKCKRLDEYMEETSLCKRCMEKMKRIDGKWICQNKKCGL